MDIYLDEIDEFEDKSLKKDYHKKLIAILEEASEGDSIICGSGQGWIKNAKQLCILVEMLAAKRCRLVVEETEIDCRDEFDPETIGMLRMAKLFAQVEHNMFSKHIMQGIAKARTRGKTLGRPSLGIADIPKEVIENYNLLEQGELTKTDYAKRCNISRPTLNKYLEIMKNNMWNG